MSGLELLQVSLGCYSCTKDLNMTYMFGLVFRRDFWNGLQTAGTIRVSGVKECDSGSLGVRVSKK